MTMLTKLFASNKLKPSSLVKPAAAAAASAQPSPPPPPGDCQKPLRIIHAGGLVECYYMAVPASSIMNKYPRCVLARPDVFHRPWDSLVRPEEILTPGQKFYIVPRGTVRKLQKRMRRPSTGLMPVGESESESVSDLCNKPLTVKGRKPSGNSQTVKGPPRRKKVRFVVAWQPSLVSIDELSPVIDLPPRSAGGLC